MDVWFRVSVLLSASVALAYSSVSSPAHISRLLESITSAGHVVDVYNRGSRENAAFHLLEMESKPGEGGALLLKFTIKETLCLKTAKQSLQNCDFKDDGLVKFCSAFFDRDPPVLVVTCDSVTTPAFRTKRFRRKSGRSSGSRMRTKKRKSQEGATRANPGNPGGWSAISKFEEHNPVRPRNSNDGNGRRTRGRKCVVGVKCKKERLRVRPTVYSIVQRSGPHSAEEKPLRPKRSPNTNGSSNGNKNRPKKLKCKAGDKCKKEPDTVGAGGFSAIAKVPLD